MIIKNSFLLICIFSAGFFSALFLNPYLSRVFKNYNNKDYLSGLLLIPSDREIKKTGPCNFETLKINPLDQDGFKWLDKSIKDTRLYIIGENHYSRETYKIRDALFFYINSKDYFPFIILEQPLSYTLYYNEFINIRDSDRALDFLRKNNFFAASQEDLDLALEIKKWNRNNPEKRLFILCADIEHDYMDTFVRLIKPFFKTLESYVQKNTTLFSDQASLKSDLDTLFSSKILLAENITEKGLKKAGLTDINDLEGLFLNLVKNLARIKQREPLKNIFPPERPFISIDHIKDIINNIIALIRSRKYDFNFYRQKRIIENITKSFVLNRPLDQGKALFHCGSYHGPTNLDYPDDGDFLREGSYFQHAFEKTEKKCTSLVIKTLFRYAGKNLLTKNPDAFLFQGSYYVKLFKKFQKAFKIGLIDENTLLTDQNRDYLFLLLYKAGLNNNMDPYLIKNMKKITSLNNNSFMQNNDLVYYDYHIIVPASQLIDTRYKVLSDQQAGLVRAELNP
jgi:hypothetical protein